MKTGTLVKLTQPEKGEEIIIYVVTNYNEVTKLALIQTTNLPLAFQPIELVHIFDITKI